MGLKEKEQRIQDEAIEAESLVQKKVSLLGAYLSLTEEMMACVERNESESLGELLARRQRCMEEVDKNDVLLRRASREQAGEVWSEHDRARIESILAEAESLEKELLRRMREEAETLQGEVRKMQNARSAAGTYRGDAIREPRFLDVRGQ